MKHEDIPLGYQHAPHNWEYADETERAAATGMLPADIGKEALQLDDFSRWTLTDDDPVTWSPVSKGASSAELATALGGTLFAVREAKTGAYTVVLADKGKLFDATSGTWTLALDPAATLTSGFAFGIFNSGSGVITIDPDGTETIRDFTSSATTKTLGQGEGGIIICDGVGFLFLKIVTPAGSGDMVLASAQSVTGAKTFADAAFILAGLTSGTVTVKAPAVAGTATVTLPAGTDTLVGRDSTDTLTNKTLVAPALGTPVSGNLANCVIPVVFQLACSDETTALTTGAGKAKFRAPFAFTLTGVRASVTTAPTGGTLLAVDINEGGASVLSTVLTFDASEKTTTTAATPAVISDSAIADDAEISIDVDAVGSTIAGAGLKVTLIGTKP